MAVAVGVDSRQKHRETAEAVGHPFHDPQEPGAQSHGGQIKRQKGRNHFGAEVVEKAQPAQKVDVPVHFSDRLRCFNTSSNFLSIRACSFSSSAISFSMGWISFSISFFVQKVTRIPVKAINRTVPVYIKTRPIRRPGKVIGVMSPYPTVVIVETPHQRPSKN